MARTQTSASVKREFSLGTHIAPPRFLLFLVLLPVTFFGYRAAFHPERWQDAAAMAFDVAALAFIISVIPLLRECKVEKMRENARNNDANKGVILLLTTLISLVVMAAISGELPGAQKHEFLAMAKLVGTLLLSWLFTNLVYTMNYAHAYYSESNEHDGDVGGLDVPGDKTPEYSDFAYFSFTLGMTFQTSDVAITSTSLRSVALLQSFSAFVFNIGVIAFTINALGGGG